MRKGLFATLEDEAGLAQVVADQGPVVPEVVAEVAEGSAELTQDAGEVGDLVAQVEDAQLADQELQQVADTMQQSIDEGVGLDTGAAQMAEIATESIMNRLGLKGQRVIPATESFGSSNSRVAATRIAMESVMDTIKNVWMGIQDFLKMVWQKITDFFAKFFANAEKLEKAAIALKAEVSKIKGKKAKESDFDDSGIAKAFAVGSGKTDSKQVITILDRQSSLLKGTNDCASTAFELVKEVSNLGSLQALEKNSATGTAVVAVGQKLIKKCSLDGTAGTAETKDKTETVSFGPFVGGMLVKMKRTDKGEGVYEYGADFDEMEKNGDGKKNDVLTETEMNQVLDKVVVLAKEAIEFKKVSANLNKVNNELNKATESVIKAIDANLSGKEAGDQTDASRKALDAVKGIVTGSTKIVSRMSSQAPVMAVKAGNAALKYVQASMKQYKEEEKK